MASSADEDVCRDLRSEACSGASQGGWTTVAPSALSFGEGYAVPRELDEPGVRKVVAQFAAAVERARSPRPPAVPAGRSKLPREPDRRGGSDKPAG